jgi:predicted outer membrane repeat protein
MLSAVIASAKGDSVRGRFVPGEIIVKFRAPPADVNDDVKRTSLSDKSKPPYELQNLQGRFRVREMKPLLKDSPRRQTRFQARGDRGVFRLAGAERSLLRHRRAIATGTTPDPSRVYRVRLDLQAGQTLDEVLAEYRSRPDVEYAERNPMISIYAVPSDSLYGEQWSLSKIQASDAWDTCRGDHEVVVAVIDTGVDYSHRDLQHNVWINEAELDGVAGVDDDGNGYVDDMRGYNFAYNNNDPADDHGHGTHCAGTIGAVGNDGLDVAGICWTARIMPLKVLGAEGEGSAADAVPAIYYAVDNGADVISVSWGGEEGSETLREAIAYAHHEGVVVVAAAGNEGSGTPCYPAAYPEVISVAATESNDRRLLLSNYGDGVDIAAPGRDILSLRATGTSPIAARDEFTCRMSGTSMAAPHVSGACALLLSANPLLTCDEVHEILMTTGDPIEPGICASNGRLNVYKALRAALPAAGIIRFDRAYYGEHADIGILLADWDLRGTGQRSVVLEAGSGDRETVTLTETDVSLGVFRGTMASGSGVAKAGDGLLEVRNGEDIYARYLDGDDGLGQDGRWRQTSAVADYEPPTVAALRVERNGPTARIELLTDEPTHVEIRYGKMRGGPYTRMEKSSEWSERHTIELRGLEPQIPYWFVAALVDIAGNETLAGDGGPGYAVPAGDAFAGFRVPGTYPTIQAAIDDAVDGDTVWVADGTYMGQGNRDIDFRGKAITVRSENGPASCIIDCNGQGRAFYFHSGETAAAILDGFTIRNGGDVDFGGGIHCMGSSPTIRNCTLVKNSALLWGGGLCNSYGSNVTVINCTFQDNSCPSLAFGHGGGMANRHGSNPTVTDCVFVSNSAKESGGALASSDASSPVVTRCTFRGNSAGDCGGAVDNLGAARPTFEMCIFTGNRAENAGGAMYSGDNAESVLTHCIFSNNIANRSGGALANSHATMVLTNCTISGNQAQQSCGGIWTAGDGTLRLEDSIVWGNVGSEIAGQAESAQIMAVRNSEVIINYCDVQGWTGTHGGLGNFGLDPLFVDPDNGDFHLKSQGWRWDAMRSRWTYDAVTSPCIDAGNPGRPLGDEPTSVPDDPNHAPAENVRIDMGAYGGTAEASLAPSGWSLRADVNNDGDVNWLDLINMADAWLQAGRKHGTDLTRDGTIDIRDLALLAGEWRHRARLPGGPVGGLREPQAPAGQNSVQVRSAGIRIATVAPR